MAFTCIEYAPTSAYDLFRKIASEMVRAGWTQHDFYINYTSGGTHQVLAGDTLRGATTTTNQVVISDVYLESGTWAAGSAAGMLR